MSTSVYELYMYLPAGTQTQYIEKVMFRAAEANKLGIYFILNLHKNSNSKAYFISLFK